ncbi:MAG: formate--tetrahydrofolate ligase [Candidatus Methanomethylophilaceae archaeon]|jgi:formate--tetrahydrofolate ligase|nr:formate--tetrahydrofolate ligase [Candidatus Methanomethylophilaceae archaeon]NCA73506.1 formate--tetrahydrofolate ligase [Gammaproteobacteria bacterium]MDD2935684.1 formate--tetrahydrofolate ligase [Candidatus Methanomethylophilaceae archaeon]MDD3351130.1 formate--tetrahydrofolate ligase [Candidatus Methanomethylophilaceae archaeon]MDD3986179.1 formate--tetrahydrofolate ligase [Candidatus Methanomethylophilaceae archaeon]
MKTDIEIAYEAEAEPITDIASKLGLGYEEISPYGRYMAKVPLDVLKRFERNENGKLIMVTAVTPTPAGEGKTVTTIGLIQGLGKIGKKVVGALREPSLGPVFGIKGGATGGGKSQVYPMWNIDLHFTGDIHAVSAAHNLLSAVVENHLVKGNDLNIDPTRVVLKKAMDMNARELRNVIVGLGGRTVGGIPHESGFLITSASEISAILALSTGYEDLRARLERIVVAYNMDGEPVTAGSLGCVGGMMVLLKDAICPNLVQTLEGEPVFVHGFPFANIAHGANSILATRSALKMGEYVVTEAGFASDLGGEKFMDIVCRQSGLSPDCVVIVASVRALMMHGGADLKDEGTMTLESLKKGLINLDRHIENMKLYGVPLVVSINRFESDTEEQAEIIGARCKELGVRCVQSEAFLKGGEGAVDLAEAVVEQCGRSKDFNFLYKEDASLKSKIETIATRIYGAGTVSYSAAADKALSELEKRGFGKLPVCIAKTQASVTDNAKIKGAPRGWDLNVREVQLSAGAGFVVPVCGSMTLMPGLPSVPAAMRMDLMPDGKIAGLK